MFGVGVGVRVGGFTASSGGGFDPDAQAFFDRVTTAGGTLSTTEKNATNQLVLDMKSAGIWSSMKAVYPMVGASAAACAQNLKSSSFTGTFTSGWTFASTGVTPNGTSAYMDTNISPSATLSQNSTHISFYSRTNVARASIDFNSNVGASPCITLLAKWSDNTSYYGVNSAEVGGGSPATSLGLYIASRTGANNLKLYKNNTIQNTSGAASTGIPTANLTLAKGGSYYSNRECALASVGDGLNDTQASDFYTAVQAFQTTLSRQV
jgi:hypothetical protein